MAKGQNDQADIRVVVGVKGGTKVDGESGNLIAQELNTLAQNLDKKGTFKLSVNIHTDKAAQTALQTQLDTLAKKMKLTVDVAPTSKNTKGSGSSSSKSTSRSSNSTKQKDYTLANTKYSLSKITSLEKAWNKLKALQDNALKFNDSDAQGAFQQVADKYNELTGTLQSYQTVKSKLSDTTKIDVEKEISALNILIDKYKQLYNQAHSKASKSDLQKNQEDVAAFRQRFAESTKFMNQYAGRPQVEEYNRLLQEVNTSLTAMETNVSRTSKADRQAASDKISRMQTLHKELEKLIQREQKATEYSVDYATKSKDAYARFQQYLTTISPAGLKEGAAQIELINRLMGEGTKEAFEAGSREIRDFKADMKSMGYEGGNFITYLQGKIKTFATYLTSTAITGAFISCFANMKSSVIELDEVLTDLMIVTGDTRTATEDLLRTYNKMAQQLGSTTADTARGATDWLRQGFSEAESAELLKQSMTLSIVGAMESTEATDALTASLKGYQLAVKDASGVVDKFFTVDVKAATSAAALATALAKTAANAKLAGLSLDDVIGQLAVVNETMKESGEETGTFYNTMLSRMGAIKSGRLEDPESGEDLSDVETTLRGLEIELRDSSGQFRNFGVVLDEVGSKWESFSSTQQRAIATAFSGTRQQTRFLTLMQGWSKAGEYAEAAADSAGVAAEKLATYQESLEAKANKATAAFENMATSLLPTGLLGLFYDAQAAVFNFGAAFGGLPATLIATTAGIIGLATAMDMLVNSSVKDSFLHITKGLGTPIQIQIGVNNCA